MDGRYVSLSASVQAVAERLFHAIGRRELIQDPRFATNEARVAHDDLLDPIVADFIAELTQAEALAHFMAADVTVGPILDAADLAEHAYIAERGVLASYPDPQTGQLPMHHVSPQLSATPGAIHSPAPEFGEHTRALLAELDYDDDAMEAMAAEGTT